MRELCSPLRRSRLARLGGLILILGSCKADPPPTPWCSCDFALGGGATTLAVYPKPIEFFPYVPQQVNIYAVQGNRRELALSTEISNDGVNLGSNNAQLFRLADGSVQLQLSGYKQPPSCFRLDKTTLRLTPSACVTERTPVDCRYSSPF